MGRSGPQITAKRQLWDCVTLTMVLLSLLFRPGKSPLWFVLVFFVSVVVVSDPRDPCLLLRVPLSHGNAVGEKLTFSRLLLGVSRTLLRVFVTFSRCFEAEKSRVCSAAARPLARRQSVCGCGPTQPPARVATRASPLAEQHELTHSAHLFLFVLFSFCFPFFFKIIIIWENFPPSHMKQRHQTFYRHSPNSHRPFGKRRPRRR